MNLAALIACMLCGVGAYVLAGGLGSTSRAALVVRPRLRVRAGALRPYGAG